MKMFTAANDFHNSIVRVRPDKAGNLSARQVRRMKNVLCGCHHESGCLCSGPDGARGEQPDGELEIHEDGSASIILWKENNS